MTELRESKTLVARRQPRSNLVSRMMGVDRLLGACEDYTALDRLESRFGSVAPRTKALLTSFVIVAGFIFSTLLASGLSRNVFRVLAPTDATPVERDQWVALAKHNWWAGSDHPAGLVIYSMLAVVAMSLIFTINVVGMITLYFAVALYFVADLGADWYNKDGRYGWTPIARVFQPVYWALALFGVGIAVVIAVLGSAVPISIVGLIVLYVLVVPAYTFVPWLVFRTVERAAKAKRQAVLSNAMKDSDESNLEMVRLFVAEFARCRTARIRPMRLRTASFGVFTTTVLLPVALTALQILTPFGFGSH